MGRCFSNFLVFCILLLIIAYSCSVRKETLPEERNNNIYNHDESNEKENLSAIAKSKALQLDLLLESVVKRRGFNGNILVAFKGKLIYHRSFGLADFKLKKKLSKESVFQIASLTKQFTAMAIMMLAEDGKLEYDDLVETHLPEIPYRGITIRHLLNHTGGLPNYMWLIENHWQHTKYPYNDDVISLLERHKPGRYFKPGTRFNYSNTGYVLLASIVEKVSGENFSGFIKNKIFIPLKMDHSFVYSRGKSDSIDQKVNGYYLRRGRYRVNLETMHDGVVGDKGIYSTTWDLFKWDKALYSEQLVSRGTLAKAFTRLRLKNGYHWHYGFGFRIREFEGKKVVYHFGKWNSFQTCISRYIKDKHTIIILSNTNPKLNLLEQNIRDILY
jgi:CubicO group peptidase (beta-lactamase class C family)